MRTNSGITVKLYELNVSYRSMVILLIAASGDTTTANPTNPTIAMANATGMLAASNTNSKTQPPMPICTGVMA
jgi:hypothetical protein